MPSNSVSNPTKSKHLRGHIGCGVEGSDFIGVTVEHGL